MKPEEGWRKCAEGQKTTQFCGLLEAAVAAERDACIKACRSVLADADRDGSRAGFSEYWVVRCVQAIKAREKP